MGGLKCISCEKPISRYDDYLRCTKACRGEFHIACVGISVTQFTDMKKSGGARLWSCSACDLQPAIRPRSKSTDEPASASAASVDILGGQISKNRGASSVVVASTCEGCSKLVDHFSAIITDLEARMTAELKSMKAQLMAEFKSVLQEELRPGGGLSGHTADVSDACRPSGMDTCVTGLTGSSYARAAAGSASIGDFASYSNMVKNRTQPAVIIRPKNPNQENSLTKNDMMKNINPVDSEFQLARVKHVRGGGVLVSCKSGAETKKLKKIAEEKLADTYEIKETRGISPRVRVVGISENISESVLLSMIRKNNASIVDNTSDCKLVKFASTKRNDKVYQATLQLDRKTYERVIRAGNLFIGYDSCTVYDAVEAYRCYKCNGYLHSSKSCSKPCSCPRCGGGHSVKDCTATALSCSNCVKLKNKDISVKTDHAAWDTINCRAYALVCDGLRSDILSPQ